MAARTKSTSEVAVILGFATNTVIQYIARGKIVPPKKDKYGAYQWGVMAIQKAQKALGR